MRKIAIYAGHGGKDPGAVVGKLREKDIALQVSNYTAQLLYAKGYAVITNRIGDINRFITTDAKKANDQNAEAVIEIHLNINKNTPGSGTETYYQEDNPTSKKLAEAIQSNIARLGFADRGIKTKLDKDGKPYFGILRESNPPAVLVETAFIDNPNDMKRYNPQQMAMAIVKGIEQVFPICT